MSTPRVGQAVRGSKTGRPIMAALDLLGRRGCLRILWELREGMPLTFRVLQDAATTNPSLLNTRLKELREAGLVRTPGRGLPAQQQRRRAAGRAAAAVRLGAALGRKTPAHHGRSLMRAARGSG